MAFNILVKINIVHIFLALTFVLYGNHFLKAIRYLRYAILRIARAKGVADMMLFGHDRVHIRVQPLVPYCLCKHEIGIKEPRNRKLLTYIQNIIPPIVPYSKVR